MAGLGALRRRRGDDEAVDVPAVLDALGAALEAGLPVPRALALALDTSGAATSGPWPELRRAADDGQGLAAVWSRAARRSDDPALATVARAWAVGEATGAPLAAAVRSAAATAREQRRLRAAVEAATAGARATVTVLTLLPVAGVGLAALLGVPPNQLYGSVPALVCAASGAGLLLLGRLVVDRLVARVVGRIT